MPMFLVGRVISDELMFVRARFTGDHRASENALPRTCRGSAIAYRTKVVASDVTGRMFPKELRLRLKAARAVSLRSIRGRRNDLVVLFHRVIDGRSVRGRCCSAADRRWSRHELCGNDAFSLLDIFEHAF